MDGGREYLPWMGVPTLDGVREYLHWMGGENTYLGWGYLHWMEYLPGWGYLPWMGKGVPTLDGGRVYLPWMGGGGTYLGWGKSVPTLDGGRGYLSWTGEEVPIFDGGGRGIYLGQGEGVPTLDGGGYLPCTGYATGGMSPVAFRRRTFLFFQKIRLAICSTDCTLSAPVCGSHSNLVKVKGGNGTGQAFMIKSRF